MIKSDFLVIELLLLQLSGWFLDARWRGPHHLFLPPVQDQVGELKKVQDQVGELKKSIRPGGWVKKKYKTRWVS